MLSSAVKLFSTNPVSAVSMVVSLMCMPKIFPYGEKIDTICQIQDGLSKVSDMFNSVMGMGALFDAEIEPPVEFCEEIDL